MFPPPPRFQIPSQGPYVSHVYGDLGVALIVAAFYESPEVLTGAQRLIQHGIETVGDNIPAPWGPRIEFVFREIGGLIWLQITIFVVILRVGLSLIAAIWRLITQRGNDTD